MKRFSLVAILLLITACASTGPGQKYAKTIEEGCAFYQTAKPRVASQVEWAKAHWEDTVTTEDGRLVPLIPDDQKDLLLQINKVLPTLDQVGQFLCVMANPVPGLQADATRVDWDQVFAETLRLASMAAQLKAAGAL